MHLDHALYVNSLFHTHLARAPLPAEHHTAEAAAVQQGASLAVQTAWLDPTENGRGRCLTATGAAGGKEKCGK